MKKFNCFLRKLEQDADNRSVDKYIEEFALRCRSKGLAEKTLSIYAERLDNFYRFLKERSINFENADRATIREYINSQIPRELSRHTINGRIRVLKTFFKFLVEEELWKSSNPMEKIDFLKTEKIWKPVLTSEDINTMLNGIRRDNYYGQRAYVILIVFWDTLIRLSELINIRLDDIDWKNSSITVMGKGSKERVVYFGNSTAIALRRFWTKYRQSIPGQFFFCDLQGKPLSIRNVEKIVERLGKKLEGKYEDKFKVTPHLIRHSGASHLAMSGLPGFMLQKIMGHSSITTTQIYISLQDNEKLRKQYQRYSPADSLAIS
jgi:site-specific recombinase XerD